MSSSATHPAIGKSSVLRTSLLVALVFIVVWGLTLGYWRSVYRIPSVGDVAIFLIALPLGLVVGFVGLRRGIDSIKQRRELRAAALSTTSSAEEASPGSADPALDFYLEVRGHALRLPAGESTDELVEAARQGRRPSLHPQLRDTQGMPVLAASVTALDAVDMDDEFPPTLDAPGMLPEQRRALWLAAAAARELLEQAEPTGTAQAPLKAQLALPAGWSEASRAAAQLWLGARLAEIGWTSERLSWQILAMESPGAMLQHIDELNLHLNRQARASEVMLLACESSIGEQTVAEASAQRKLLSNANPEGKIPGEGACALLLCSSAKQPSPADAAPLPTEDQPPAARLQRLMAQQHDRSVDLPGRPQLDTLGHLLQRALSFTHHASWPDSTGVITDADHRGNRQVELLGAVNTVVPEFDFEGEAIHLGIANGDGGAATLLAAIALAAARVEAGREPQLVIGVDHPRLRQVMLLQATPQPAPSASTTA